MVISMSSVCVTRYGRPPEKGAVDNIGAHEYVRHYGISHACSRRAARYNRRKNASVQVRQKTMFEQASEIPKPPTPPTMMLH